MANARTYDDGCAIAHGLNLVGERWALLVVRELLLGPKRFADLRKGLPGASADVLSRRLRSLEEVGVIRRRRLPPPAASRVYELTDWGRELEPVVISLGAWAARSASLPLDARIGTDSMALALRTMFSPEVARGVSIRLNLRLGEDEFGVTVADGEFSVKRGSIPDPEVVIETDPSTVRAMVFGGYPLDAAVESGAAEVHGDAQKARLFMTLFSLPPTSGAPGGRMSPTVT